MLQGSAPPTTTQIANYNEDLSKVKVEGQPLFKKVYGPKWVDRSGAAGPTICSGILPAN